MRRSLQIISLFLRLGVMVGAQRLLCWVGIPLFRPDNPSSSAPYLLRTTLEKLGGAFMKLGQLLAMRPDILSDDYITELSHLLDRAPEFAPSIAREIIETELKKPMETLFDVFHDKPLAAGSMAQVHKAKLKTGEWVAVKVQRPGIQETVEGDITLIRLLAVILDGSGIFRRVTIRPIIDDFIAWTRDELDFLQEATYAHRLREKALKNPNAAIPKIYWDFTTSRVLTLEFFDGIWLSAILNDLDERGMEARFDFAKQGIDLSLVATHLFYNALFQVFEDGLFHADMHAGNLILMPDHVIGYVDFGIIGEIGKDLLSAELGILDQLQREDLDGFFRALLRVLDPPPETMDLRAFETEVKQNVRSWRNAFYNPRSTLADRSGAAMITRNVLAARKYGLKFAEIAIRYYRVLTMVEMIVLRLDPTFNMQGELRECIIQIRLRTLLKETTPARAFENQLNNLFLLRSLPEVLTGASEQFRRDREIVFSAVSNFKHRLASSLKMLYRLLILVILAAPFINHNLAWFVSYFHHLHWSNRPVVITSLIVLVLILIRSVRHLDSTSILQRTVTRRQRH